MTNQSVFPTNELRKKKGIFTGTEKIVLFLLFMGFFDFRGQGCYFILLASAFYLLITGGNVALSKGLIPPLLFTTVLAVSWEAVSNYRYSLCIVASMPICFFIGYGLINRDLTGEDTMEAAQKRLKGILIVIIIGFFLHFLLNMLYNIGNTSYGRNTIDIWTMQSRAATGQAALVCLAIGLIMSYLFSNSSKLIKTICAVALGIIILYNFTLSTRTIFVLIFIIAAVAAIYFFKNSEDLENRLKVVIVIISVVFLLWVFYELNVFGIRDIFEDSNFYKRFFGYRSTELDDDDRFELKKKFIPLMPKYLWGGSHIRKQVGNFAHDVLLDTYDDVGIIALFAVAILLFCGSAKIINIIKNSAFFFETKQLLLCILLAFLLEFSVEPILQGAPLLLIAFCLIYGMNSALLDKTELLN